MLTLKMAQTPPAKKSRRGLKVLICACLFATPFLVEHFRGRWLLSARAREIAARGESLDSTNLWPEPSSQSIEFSNSLSLVIGQLTGSLKQYAGQITACMPDNSGKWHRGSQMPWPVIQGTPSSTSWEEVRTAVNQNEAALRQLRNLMKNPPEGVAYKLKRDFNEGGIPNFVSFRVGAQTFFTVAISQLHQGDLSAALENILALRAFTKLNSDDPGLVSLMIRIAILGIANDLCWDALQAKPWSDEQLQQLQRACESDRKLLERIPNAYLAERAYRLHEIEMFRTHSYEAWVARMEPIFRNFGTKDSDIASAVAPRALRQWALHPLWSFCCADQEAANYLQATDAEYEALRAVAKHKSCQQLTNELASAHAAYRAPAANWRFYTRLPLLDDIPGALPPNQEAGEFPYGHFNRAWQVATKNLAVNELVIAAIAIKRYELRHGQPPATLAALAPEFLSEVPADFMDGKPLRYRLIGTGILLYSVGDDATDDGGNSSPTAANPRALSPWSARDCVWPVSSE